MTADQNSLQTSHRSKLEHFWLDGEVGRLHPAEQKLLDCVAKGDVCEIAMERPVAATRENIIRSSFLRFLILGGDEQTPVHERGIQVSGGFIDCNGTSDEIDLRGAVVNFSLQFWNSKINGDLMLGGASTKTIDLQGCEVDRIVGDTVLVNGNLLLRYKFSAKGKVSFSGAKITGIFDCENATFSAADSALYCDRIETTGSVFLRRGFHALGTVRFIGAKIGGSFSCADAVFSASDVALNIGRIQTSGDVFLRHGFTAIGSVSMKNAKIGGALVCSDCFFSAEKNALVASSVEIAGNLSLNNSLQASGEVDFRNAHIGGNVYCNNAIFSCKNQSLVFNRATINGMVLLGKGLMAAGQISFAGAKIGRDFSVQGVSLEGNPSLQLRNAEIRGTLTWRGIKYAHGQLDLTGVSCRDFSFDEYSWKKPKEIKLTDFAYKSFTELPLGADGDFWREWLEKQPNSHLQTKFRPKPYEYLADILSDMGNEEESRAVRIEKQRRQTRFIQKHQPRPRRPFARMVRNLNIFWRRAVLGPFIDYGYRPGKAGLYGIAIGLVGALIYWWAAVAGIITPANPLVYKEAHLVDGIISPECKINWVYTSKNCATTMPSEHSEFQPFWYSFDVLLPVVNLRQQDDWSPRVVHANGSNWWAGRLVRWWEWFQISAGWVLSLLFVSAIGGIIKR